jgi:hypothetical protein
VAHTAKAPLIRNIINQQYAHRTSVVCCCDGSESLLACCVPYLQLDAFAIQVYCTNLEVDTDRRNEGGCETVFRKAEETARFAYTRVAY